MTVSPVKHDIRRQKVRRATATRTAASKREIPHFYLSVDVDMTAVIEHRDAMVAVGEPKPSITAIIMAAAATTLLQHPQYNVGLADNEVRSREAIAIGLAIASPFGLLVATMPYTAEMTIAEIGDWIRGAADRCDSLRLKPSDLGPKSLVISNLGKFQVDSFLAIIDMPDPLIVSLGRSADRVVVIDSAPAIRPTCTVSLSADHRVFDGADAARFLGALKENIEGWNR